MKQLIVSYYAQKLDDGNMNLFFVKDKEGKLEGLTELGKEVVHTTTAIAASNRNEDVITDKNGFNSKTNEYEAIDGNFYNVVNFSDLVGMSDSSLLARNYCTESKCDLTFDQTNVVSPAMHKENLDRINAKFKNKDNKFSTKKISKGKFTINQFDVLYKGEGKYFVDTALTGNTVAVSKEVVYLRKIAFKNAILEGFYDEVRNVVADEDYLVWLYKKSEDK